jgi:LacI family transcriptional regulator
VLQAAEDLGYDRNSRSKRLLYGLVMEEVSAEARAEGFVDSLIQGVFRGAREVGAQIALGLFHPGVDPLEELRDIASRPLSGLIVANGGDMTLEVIDRMAASRIPLVLVENRVDRPISSVSSDNITAGLTATRHLLDLGHRRIGVIKGSDRYISLTDRFRGYLLAMNEAGLSPEADLIVDQQPHSPHKGYEQAHRLLSLPEPPTAIYAVSDRSAMGALEAIAERGLRAGVDVSVVGTDNIDSSAIHSPALTTFDTASGDLGPVAVQRLASLASESRIVSHTVVEGRLIVRESTGSLHAERMLAP